MTVFETVGRGSIPRRGVVEVKAIFIKELAVAEIRTEFLRLKRATPKTI